MKLVAQSKNKVFNLSKLFLCCSAALGSYIPLAHAEAQDKEDAVIESIIVTAQKTAQSIQEVPASVDVITSDVLATSGSSSGTDILKHTPAITLYQDQDPRNTRFTIRGISGTANRSSVEPSASIIVDGETMPRPAALNMDLADLERVEILRGPQGTLFGKNASAGAIHIITKRPVLDASFSELNFTLAEDNEFIVHGSTNLSLSETTALRLNSYYRYTGGWIPNLDNSEPDGGHKKGAGMRAQLLYAPTSNLELLTRVEYSHEDYGPYAKILTDIPMDALTDESVKALELSGDLGNISANNRTTSQTGSRNYGELDNVALSLEGRYTLPEYDIVYAGSYRDWKLYTNEDQSLIKVNVVPCYFCGDTNMETLQQELRVESTSFDTVNFVGGVFYNRQEIFRSEGWQECIVFPGGLPSGTIIDPSTLNITDCGGNGMPLNTDAYFESNLTVDNYAIFGNVDWFLTEELNLFAGARALIEKQTLTYEGGFNNIPYLEMDTDDNAIIGRVGAKYFFNKNIMAYTSYSTGYKGKGWDNGIGIKQDALTESFPINAERPAQIEVGLKSDFWDNRARVNLSVFKIDIKDYQDSATYLDESIPSGKIGRLVNAGDVRSEGAELDFQALIGSNFVFTGAISWVDASYTSTTYANCNDVGRTRNICETFIVDTSNGPQTIELANRKGQQLPNSVKLSYNLGAEYTVDMNGGYEGTLALAHRWQDEQEFEFSDAIAKRDAFGVTNLSISTTSPDDSWRVSLFINNLFDKEYTERTSKAHFGGYAGGFSQSMPRDYTRYIGVSLNFKFE